MNWKKDEIYNANRTSQYYDGLYHSQMMNQKHEKKLVEFIKKNVPKDSWILDMGCGTGTLSRLLEKEYVVFGLDISKDMLMYSNIQAIQADGEMIPFKTCTFDAVICSNTLHHYPTLNLVLTDIWRVLRANGRLIILEPNKDFIGNIKLLSKSMYLITGALHKLGFQRYENNITFNETTDHHRALTSIELENSLLESGFNYKLSGNYIISHYFTDFKSSILCSIIIYIDSILKHFAPGKERYIVFCCNLVET